MDKKYVISGIKDNEEYFYKDLEAHEKIDDLSEKVDEHFTAVEEAFQNTVDKKTFNERVEVIEEAITKLNDADPDIDVEAFEAKINEAIEEAKNSTINEHNVDLETVKQEIKSFHKKDQLFEIKNTPEGTLIDYNCKEIRIMCPKNTDWNNQHEVINNPNYDPNMYCINLYAYAPENAVAYREILSSEYLESINEEKIEQLQPEINAFSGIDDYNRKYSILWLPVAINNEGTWTYYGSDSTYADFTGWYYSVEWYDEEEQIIKADTIRINLTNEDWFRYIEPYHEKSIWKKYEELETKYNELLERVTTLENNQQQ